MTAFLIIPCLVLVVYLIIRYETKNRDKNGRYSIEIEGVGTFKNMNYIMANRLEETAKHFKHEYTITKL